MNKKYERYINFIVSDIEAPYLINMRDAYGLSPDEYELVLSKIFNQPVIVRDYRVYDINGNRIYFETSDGYWYKKEYDNKGNLTYFEDSNGDWVKHEYDINDNEIYSEYSDGVIRDNR